MFADAHYDLLTHVYMYRNNLEDLKSFCNIIYNPNNVTHGILNLFFMSKQEMFNDLGIEEAEIDVLTMLRIADEIIKQHNLLPNPKNFVYGIEGCDYLDLEELELLWELGVRSLTIVWNEVNIYGSGNRGEKEQGLTDKGIKLIKKAVDLGIIVDLSHANEQTFWDVIELLKGLKQEGETPLVMVSHSNAKDIYNKGNLSSLELDKLEKTLFMKRNITDAQILAIKELDGLIGVVIHKKMIHPVFDNKEIVNISEPFNAMFLEQLKHIINLIGIKNILISTDNMCYDPDPICPHLNNCKYEDTQKFLLELLEGSSFSEDNVKSIMYRNFEEKVLSRFKNN